MITHTHHFTKSKKKEPQGKPKRKLTRTACTKSVSLLHLPLPAKHGNMDLLHRKLVPCVPFHPFCFLSAPLSTLDDSPTGPLSPVHNTQHPHTHPQRQHHTLTDNMSPAAYVPLGKTRDTAHPCRTKPQALRCWLARPIANHLTSFSHIWNLLRKYWRDIAFDVHHSSSSPLVPLGRHRVPQTVDMLLPKPVPVGTIFLLSSLHVGGGSSVELLPEQGGTINTSDGVGGRA